MEQNKGTWDPDNSVDDAEIALMAKKDAIKSFNIVESQHDKLYFVTLKYTWREELIHLATRRLRTEPKMWKSLDRLLAHIKSKFPGVKKVNLLLNEEQQEGELKQVEPKRKPPAKKPVVTQDFKSSIKSRKTKP